MSVPVRSVRTADGWRLLRNGAPYPVRGAVGGAYPERLAAAGGNSVRAGVNYLPTAERHGLTVLANLGFGKQRWGFNYRDRAAVSAQLDALAATVKAHRDHPALLAWAIGNELEIATTAEDRVPLWTAVNEAAEAVHAADPLHPVITVLGCDFIAQRMLPELDALCPALDAVGLNAYADMLHLPEHVADQAWKRPWLVTEFGPRGHWQVAKTAWGMPIEDTSTQKAEFYARAYAHAVAGQPACLGAYVFHWSQHHEKTHTWYGMFLPDGSPLGAVDAMQEAWTGRPPAHPCPRIGAGGITVDPWEGGVVEAGARLRCRVNVEPLAGEAPRVTWDLRPDVADNPNVGGDREEPAEPIPGAVLQAQGSVATVAVPSAPGPYRLFVYVHNAHGGAATANVPLLAR